MEKPNESSSEMRFLNLIIKSLTINSINQKKTKTKQLKIKSIMKKINLFAVLSLAFSMSFAQNAPVNFETGGQGANWNWTVFENSTNPPLDIVANPNAAGINTSATVAKFTALNAGQPWAGFESAHGATNLGPFVLDASNSTIKIKVWKSVISDVGIKLIAASGWAMPEIKIANTLVNQWEELTFNFASYPNPPAVEGAYDQIAIFPDFNLAGRGQDNVIYIDDITFGPAAPPSVPTTPAPTPTQPAANVISIYSDTYTGIGGVNYNPNWGQSTVFSEIQIQGNNTLRYSNLNYQGIDLGSNINVSSKTFVHIDVWSATSTNLRFFLISPGPVETPYVVNVPTTGWLSLNIPLASFSPVDLASVFQFKFDGNGEFFVDNIFFYDAPIPVPTTAAPTPIKPAADVISIYSDAYTNVAGTNFNPSWGQSTQVSEVQIQGNNTYKYTNLNYQGIELAGNTDVVGMEFLHIDVWSALSSALNIYLISPGPVETPVAISVPTTNWSSLDIPLSSFSPVALNSIFQMKFDGNGEFYMDNLYFWKTTVSAVDQNIENNAITVFPNPSTRGNNVKLNMPVRITEILDVNGKLINTSTAQNIETASLTKGMYILRITELNGKVSMKKLIIQ
jgi:hypothetical protein